MSDTPGGEAARQQEFIEQLTTEKCEKLSKGARRFRLEGDFYTDIYIIDTGKRVAVVIDSDINKFLMKKLQKKHRRYPSDEELSAAYQGLETVEVNGGDLYYIVPLTS